MTKLRRKTPGFLFAVGRPGGEPAENKKTVSGNLKNSWFRVYH
jgi:hypothetical protein